MSQCTLPTGNIFTSINVLQSFRIAGIPKIIISFSRIRAIKNDGQIFAALKFRWWILFFHKAKSYIIYGVVNDVTYSLHKFSFVSQPFNFLKILDERCKLSVGAKQPFLPSIWPKGYEKVFPTVMAAEKETLVSSSWPEQNRK